MDSSNCNCCCGCQYSTPPWWVTMGFVSPYNNQQVQMPPAAPYPIGGTVNVRPPTGTAVPPAQGGNTSGGGGLGGIIGGILNPLGGLLGGLL